MLSNDHYVCFYCSGRVANERYHRMELLQSTMDYAFLVKIEDCLIAEVISVIHVQYFLLPTATAAQTLQYIDAVIKLEVILKVTLLAKLSASKL